ncbi:hypothetical protein [Halegenticoccus tardaugens]|uniref:hypothetical protein n=1 Tax=Halegenticoccus tardaugens TaxID=2071624 RepID=UPI00100B6CCF|nr:hypothetical protein [Halegenticoccus tardaugens]
MSDESFDCPDCGAEIASKDGVEKGETVREITFDEREGTDEPPRVVLGAGRRNLWLCRRCGKVLGVN